MPEIIKPMKKQVVYAEGKLAFAFGSHRGFNPYSGRNKQLASIWVDGWDQAKTDDVIQKNHHKKHNEQVVQHGFVIQLVRKHRSDR